MLYFHSSAVGDGYYCIIHVLGFLYNSEHNNSTKQIEPQTVNIEIVRSLGSYICLS